MDILYTLDLRCQKILRLLINSSSYLSVNGIASTMDVSRRCIYYDLERINEWLDVLNIEKIEIERNKGILLSGVQKNDINYHLLLNTNSSYFYFSPMERCK
ncbi:MAG: helix-turn-helix domain-containing protein, partial [Erysipelotrichaceae bacterium]